MKNYMILNESLKIFGVHHIEFEHCIDVLFATYETICLKYGEKTIYVWPNDDKLAIGNYTNYGFARSIFDYCRKMIKNCRNGFEMFYWTSDVEKWMNFIAGCESFEEIRLKMQLMGFDYEKL